MDSKAHEPDRGEGILQVCRVPCTAKCNAAKSFPIAALPPPHRAVPGSRGQGARARNEGAYSKYVTEIPMRSATQQPSAWGRPSTAWGRPNIKGRFQGAVGKACEFGKGEGVQLVHRVPFQTSVTQPTASWNRPIHHGTRGGPGQTGKGCCVVGQQAVLPGLLALFPVPGSNLLLLLLQCLLWKGLLQRQWVSGSR